MEKLIVVGMRYQSHASVQAAIKAAKAGKTSVTLQAENNAEGYNGKVLGVYFQGVKVGFVRNADLAEALRSYLRYDYTIRSTATNYWILDGKPSAAAQSLSKLITGDVSDYRYTSGGAAGNPCGEISSATGGTTCILQVDPNYLSNTSNTPKFKKDEKKMINTNSMRDSFFREVKNVAIDMQSGKFGIITNEGISVFVDGGISVNPITDFGVKVPAFAMRVAITDLKAGDIIVGGVEPTFFVGLVKDGGYEVVTMSGEHKLVGTVTNMFFGKNTVLAVKNMFGEGMNPMMMAMMMGDDSKGDGFDMKTFALMSMMGNMGGKEGATGMDPNMLMMMMMMGK